MDKQVDLSAVIELRPFEESDFVEVLEMQSNSFAQLAKDHYTNEQMAANERFFRDPAYRAELKKCNLTLALIGREIAGSAGWCVHAPEVARVRKVFVLPKYVGRGLGRRLVGHVENQVRGAGFRETILRASMNAIPFYEKLGFVRLREETRILDAGVSELAMIMRKSLG